MLRIVSNPTDLHVLGKWCKFKAVHDITERLSPLTEWHRNQIGASDRKVIGHVDDARPHTAPISLTFLYANEMTKVPIPLFTRFGSLWFLPVWPRQATPLTIQSSRSRLTPADFGWPRKNDLGWCVYFSLGWIGFGVLFPLMEPYRTNKVFLQLNCDMNHPVTRC
jgi:hypothetical protein